MISAGDLNKPVTIEQPTPNSRNEFGEQSSEWSTFADVWASIEPLTGQELFQAQQVSARASIKFRIRWLNGLLPTMRIKFGNRIFSIVSGLNLMEEGEEHLLMCQEAVD